MCSVEHRGISKRKSMNSLVDLAKNSFFNHLACFFFGHSIVGVSKFNLKSISLGKEGFYLDGAGQYQCTRCKKILNEKRNREASSKISKKEK